MDSRVTTLLGQFQEIDQKRMAWEADQARRELAEQSKSRSDATVKQELIATGVDIKKLESESGRAAKDVANAFAAPEAPDASVAAPPSLGELLSGDLQPFRPFPAHTLSADTLRLTLTDPAIAIWGNTEACGANLELRELNLFGEVHGSGWGWDAIGVIPQECTLWFAWYPPRPGDLTVRLRVEAQGRLRAIVEDHWWSGTNGEAHLEVGFDLYQHYFDGEIGHTVLNFNSQHAHFDRHVSKAFSLVKSLSVSDDAPVLMKFKTIFWVLAHSEYAAVRCDFRTGANRFVRVSGIDLVLR